jgi:opacity protein-like surface antigen
MKAAVSNTPKQYGYFLRRFSIDILAAILALLALTANARAQDNDHRFTLQGGVGASPLVGGISDRLDNGWHITVGGGYNFTHRFSATLDYTYNGYGVSKGVLNEAQVPDGNAHMWSLTVNPRLQLTHNDKFNPYVVGGVGYYRRTVKFTQPTLVQILLFDPFFGGFFNTVIQADQVIGEITQDGIGGSAGAGFDIKLGASGAKFFTEARYHYADTGHVPTRMIPLTVGVRW